MYDQAIQTLQEIEQRFDTSKLQYHGVSYWPLCRMRMWTALTKRLIIDSKDQAAPKVSNHGPQWDDVGQVNAELFGPGKLGLLRARKAEQRRAITDAALRPRILFFARPEEYGDKVGGFAFAKMIDSVLETAERMAPCTKIEFADVKTMAFPRFFPSLYVSPEFAGRDVTFDPPGQLAHHDDLLAAVSDIDKPLAGDHVLSAATLTIDIGKIFYFARIFEKVLRVLDPKLFILSVYYHPVGMAWMLACRRAGITTVDLQHGRLGPYHGMYTQLTQAPAKGYELLPDKVWCWGRTTKHDIDVDLNASCPRHRGFIGGNPWLHKWRFGDSHDLSPPQMTEFAARHAGRHIILVSLQPLESPLGPEVLTAMRQSPSNWLWLVRVHPLRRHTAAEVGAILSRNQITNFEIEYATSMPLFALLKLAGHHVTEFSSVVVEATAFGVRTSLTSTEGAAIFASHLERGICRYTPTAKDLRDHIAQSFDGPRTALDNDFVDMNEDVVASALNALLAE